MSYIETRVLSKLDEAAKTVFTALLADAEIIARKQMRENSDVIKIAGRVSEHLMLNPTETSVLVERLKKPVVQNELINQPSETKQPSDRKNTIYFDEPSDLDEAVQILMDRSIDWAEKGSEGKPFIQFSDENKLTEAHSALRRKWDFVESQKRLVADVQFDNLSDYSKVLEFMRRQGMLLEFDDDIELDEDYDQLQTKMIEDKKAAEKENRPHSPGETVTTFTAKSRSPKLNHRVDPSKDSRFRVAQTRKKFILK